MRVASLFAGIGGFDLGLERAGMTTAVQVEIDAKCRLVLARHFPGAQRMADVREAHIERGSVDLVCGGFPCQDLSVAGKRAGLAGERSGLWFEFHRILDEVRPEWCVIENVPGLLSSNKGRDFAVILQGLEELGYLVAWRTLDAQNFGVAQRRRRVFIVGHLGDGRAAEVLFERESLRGDTPAGKAARKAVSGSLGVGAGKRGWANDTDRMTFVAFQQNTRDEVRVVGGDGTIAGALSAQPGMKQQNYISGAVSSKRAKGTGGPAGDEAYNLVATDARGNGNGQTVGLTGDHANRVTDYTPIVFEARYARNGAGVPNTIVPPLKAQSSKSDASPIIFPALRGFGHGWQGQHNDDSIKAGMVRRLTPTECERLQGFPDGWTAGQSDSARYRQLGNAVCVPVAEWIGRRIVAAETSS